MQNQLILFLQQPAGKLDLKSISQNFRNPGESVAVFLVIFVIVIGLVIVIGFGYRQYKKYLEKLDDHGSLFRELSRKHSLNGFEKRLLKSMSEILKLEYPDSLFVRIDLYDRAVEEMKKNPKWEIDPKKIVKLRNKIFQINPVDMKK